MRNYLVYYLSSVDEVYECCYSLLKYLDVYNLKPPADHSVVVYSNRPQLLEVYGSYFNHFELKEINSGSSNEIQTHIEDIFNLVKGNIIFMPANAYPVKELEPF